jgi:hypothetical protein
MMMLKNGDFGAGWQRGLMSAAMPVVDDGARERLQKIVSFFDTRCDDCIEHYCPQCTEKFKALLYDARDYLEETTE